MRVKENASESCVLFQPKADSRATNHKPMAWNRGTLVVICTMPLMGTSHQP